MERISRPLALVLAALGVFATLVFGPSSWVFKNLFDGVFYGGVPESQALGPTVFTAPWHEAPGRQIPFTDLFPASDDLDKADAFAMRAQTPAAWAADLNRHFRKNLWAKPKDKGSTEDADTCLGIANRAIASDPENGFFLISRAVFQWRLGLRKDALQSLAEASRAKTYNDYIRDEGEATIRALQDRWGYRGEIAIINTRFGSMFYPHLASFKGFFKQLHATHPSPQIRMDMLRFANVLSESGSTVIEGLVGAACGKIVLHEDGVQVPKDLKERHEYYVGRAKVLEQELRAPASDGLSPTEIVERQDKFTNAVSTYLKEPLGDDFEKSMGVTRNDIVVAVAGKTLGLLALAWLLCAGLFALCSLAKQPNLLPALTSGSVCLLGMVWGTPDVYLIELLVFGGLIMAVLPKPAHQWYAGWIVAVLMGLRLLMLFDANGDLSPVPILIASALVGGLVGIRQAKVTYGYAIGALVLAGGVLYFALASASGLNVLPGISSLSDEYNYSEAAKSAHQSLLIFCALAPILVGVTPWKAINLKRWSAWVFLAASGLFLVNTVAELRLNASLKLTADRMANEAKIVRARAGFGDATPGLPGQSKP